MNIGKAYQKIYTTVEILQRMLFNIKNETSFPNRYDLDEIAEAKSHVDDLYLLLNAKAETNGEKDCKNDGNAV